MKKRWAATALLTCAAAMGILTAWSLDVQAAEPAEPDSGLYYLQAEVVAQRDGETLFGQVDGPEPSDRTYAAPGSYDDGIPYLLTMDSMGTEAPSDDQILAVWGCMSGAE